MNQHIHGGDVYHHPNCLDFSANCNPLGLPRGVRQAVMESLDQAVNYPQVGCQPLREAIGQYEGVSPSQVICGNGAAELIYTICRARKPSAALLPSPTFAEYEQALCSVDCEIRHYAMGESLSLDENFLDALTEDLDLVFLCNPNNPTGFLLERSFLRRILKLCAKRGILLVIDECFLDFVEDGEAYSMKPELTEFSNLFLLKAFTKRYAMAGIRLGYGLTGNEELLARMELMNQPWNVSGLAQAAGVAALKETAYVEEGRRIVREQREFLKKELGKLPLQVMDSKANYIFFRGPKELWEQCKEKGILLRDCSNYQGLSKGWYRTAVRLPQENARLLEVLKEILQ